MIIYKLISPSGKCYVGQTKQHINLRFAQHKDAYRMWVKKGRIRKSYQTKLYYAFDKYTPEKFIIDQVCQCANHEELNKKEQHYIEHFNSIENGYNLTQGGHGLRGLTLSEEHKKNQSEARKEYWKTEEGAQRKELLSKQFKEKNISKKGHIAWNKGKECPQISEALKGKKSLTEDGRLIKSEKMKNKWKEGVFDNRPAPTKEVKEKISKSLMGHKSSDIQKESATKTHSKEWEIITPTKEKLNIISLNKFCKENSLAASNIQRKSGSKGYFAYPINR